MSFLQIFRSKLCSGSREEQFLIRCSSLKMDAGFCKYAAWDPAYGVRVEKQKFMSAEHTAQMEVVQTRLRLWVEALCWQRLYFGSILYSRMKSIKIFAFGFKWFQSRYWSC